MAKGHFKPQRQPRSAMHQHVRRLLLAAFPGYTVGEELPIEACVGGRRTTLFVDLAVKELKIAIECQGRQHQQFVSHFHRDGDGFKASMARDRAKCQAIKDANWTFLSIRHDEWQGLTGEGLLERIQQAMKESGDE